MKKNEKGKGRLGNKIASFLLKLGPLIGLIILYIAFSITMPEKFLIFGNQMNILKQTAVNCLIAAGMLVVLITGGIELSVGTSSCLATCVIGVLLQNFGITNPVILIVAGVAVGTLCGFVNGTLFTRLDLPHPYVVTLGMKNVYLGIALVITGSTTIGFINKGVDSVMYLGSATIGGFPVSFIFVLIVYFLFSIFLNKTALGRQIYCVGGNAEAARLSGIRSKDVLTFVYTLSGFMCGLAGVMLVGRIATANANAGLQFDTDAIASCIIGGASFSGGKGTIWGTLIGALLIGTIRNGLNLMGTSNDVQYIVIGLVIIVAVVIDVTRGKVEAKSRRLAAAATIEDKGAAEKAK